MNEPPVSRTWKQRVSGTLVSAALVVGVSWVLLAVIAWLLQGQMVYFPMGQLVASPADEGLAYEDVHIEADDGIKLHGWFVPGPGQTRRTVLFLHGNAGNISHRLHSLRHFHELGVNTLILSYRGYGHSEGRPSEAGTYRDAAAAWRHLTDERGIAPGDVVVFGRSLGGAVAGWLASEKDPAAVILESTFTSIVDLGSEHYWFLPVRLLSRFSYNTLERMPRVRSPVLVVHSPEDEIVPFHHGQALFDAAPGPKAWLELRGGHNDGFMVSGQSYLDGLAAFLDDLPDNDPPPAH